MKKILIFGDSNTWGYVPAKGTRYPPDVRWPGVAASLLGNGYELVEDAISGRTTIYEDPNVPKRCGLDCLGYSLAAHFPLDLVILFLGTNDLKFTDVSGFRMGLLTLVKTVKNAQSVLCLEHPVFNGEKKILIVGPPRINPAIIKLRPTHQLAHAAVESEKLHGIAAEIAEKEGVYFVDVSGLVFPDEQDCLHLSPESHSVMGSIIAAAVKDILQEP